MSCSSFSTTSPACRTITTIEPDDTLLTATSSGSTDQSLDESGSTKLSTDNPIVTVFFLTPKASANYSFEYLYVDALSLSGIQVNPAFIAPVVTSQTLTSFTVDLAGVPLTTGYVLRWRVVVKNLNLDASLIDSPENLRVQIPQSVIQQVITFVNPRSTNEYGFIELRVENLDDSVLTQRFVLPQVVAKTLVDFTVGYSTPVDTDNYFLIARTP